MTDDIIYAGFARGADRYMFRFLANSDGARLVLRAASRHLEEPELSFNFDDWQKIAAEVMHFLDEEY